MKEIRDVLGRKKCSLCNVWKYPEEYWRTYKVKSGLQSRCKDCKRKYDQDPISKLRRIAHQKKYHSKPGIAKKMQEARKERRRLKRRKIIEKYGGKCIKCGFDDWRALQIDHVNGGGRKELREFNSKRDLYFNLVLGDDTGKYQLLCANCNTIKVYENNEHGGRYRIV